MNRGIKGAVLLMVHKDSYNDLLRSLSSLTRSDRDWKSLKSDGVSASVHLDRRFYAWSARILHPRACISVSKKAREQALPHLYPSSVHVPFWAALPVPHLSSIPRRSPSYMHCWPAYFPPMMADLVLEQEQDVNRRRLGRVLPGSLYLAAIIAALGAQSIRSGLFESSSQIILGTSSVVALAILVFTRRERNQAEHYQRLWNLALFLTLLLIAVIASVSDNPFFSLVPGLCSPVVLCGEALLHGTPCLLRHFCEGWIVLRGWRDAAGALVADGTTVRRHV